MSCRATVVLIVLCFFSWQGDAPGEIYHVAKTGDDNGTGSESSPFLTISHAADLAHPGDTVLVHEGVYRERVAPPRGGEPGKRIVYSAAPADRVIIKGSDVWEPHWTEEGRGLFSAEPAASLFNDLKDEYVDSHNPLRVQLASTPWQREGRRERERGFRGDDRIVFTCGQVFVDGKRWLEVPLKEELKAGRWFYERESNRVYVHFGNKRPQDHLVELTTRRRIFAPSVRGLGYITVQGFIMEHSGNQYPTNFWEMDANAQKGALGTEAGHHWIIRRNMIRYAKTFAIDAGHVDKRSRRVIPESNLIEQNYIVDNGSAGILSNRSRHLIVRDNVILRNNTLHFLGLKRWEQAGIKCHGFRDGLIEHNYVADNALTYGIWLDNQFPDSRVTRNVIVNNGRAGIFLEMSDYDFDRLLVDNNIVVGNIENPVYIHDASGATFVHNLLANTKPDSEYGQAVFIRQVSARTKTYHHTFLNNLVLGADVILDVNYPAFRSGPQRFDYNVYGVAPGVEGFRVNRASDKPMPWDSVEFAKLLSRDLNREVPTASEEQRFASLSLTDWKSFWETHGVTNDTHSALNLNSVVSYDGETQQVTLTLDADPGELAAVAHPRVTHDFFAAAIAEPRLPGPFQKLTHGNNTFTVWNGLPLLADGQLPAIEWNASPPLPTTLRADNQTTSPDRRLRVDFALKDLAGARNVPVYRVWRDDQLIIAESKLGLSVRGSAELTNGFEIEGVQTTESDSTWHALHGERSLIRNHYQEMVIRLRHSESGAGVELTFRCYDAGVAICYRVTRPHEQAIQVSEERTEFLFAGDHTCWAATSAQGVHTERKLSELSSVVERPLTLQVSPTCFVAIAEAAMNDYPSMMLEPLLAETRYGVVSHLLSSATSENAVQTPWRVILLADSAGQLLDRNDIIRNLNEPCAIPDTSWLRPGKVLREMTLTTDGAIKAMDFAAKYNFQFVEFDAGWYGHEYDDSSDATTVTLDPKRSAGSFDLPKLIDYANEKQLGVILYVNRRALERQLDELLPLYKSWGVAGVKYGFVRTGSQEWNRWLHEAIRKAAEHQLMVDVHDAYRSTGYQRTYPNLMTMEGIGGDETRPTNKTALTNLFTRMLAGRADHTFCYFDEDIDALSTRACQLAKPVCFFSPWQFLFWYDRAIAEQDRPDRVLRDSPELEFYKHLPTVWDDTRVLHASIGEYAVIARRAGDDWFLGAINNDQPRALKVPLDFLTNGIEYGVDRYCDNPQGESPGRVVIKRERVTNDSTLVLGLLANGGEALRIVPNSKATRTK